MDTERMKAIVEEGVVAFAEAERRAAKAAEKALALQAVFRKASAVPMMGQLQTEEMCAKARAAAGKIAEAEVIIAGLHREATAIAEARGVDVPPPVGPLSGGGGR